MKKQFYIICSFVIGMITATQVKAQVTTLGNSGSIGDYVGWANTENFPLQIRHNGDQPINFFAGNTQRMTILGADNLLGSPQFATERAGNVGIGTRHP